MPFSTQKARTRPPLVFVLLTWQILAVSCHELIVESKRPIDLEEQESDLGLTTEEADEEPAFHLVAGKFELRTRSGRVLCRDLFDDFIPYTEGYAAVNIGAIRDPNGPFPFGGLWGYVDKSGKYSIQIQYKFAGAFSDGLAYVTTISGEQLFVNYEGRSNFKLPNNARMVGAFSESLAAVEYSGLNQEVYTSYIDKEGISQFRIAGEGEEFFEEMALFRCDTVDGKRYGYITNRGSIAIPATYIYARRFSEGLAAVCLSYDPKRPWLSKWGFIDKQGQLVIDSDYCEADSFHNGAAFVRPATGSFIAQTIREYGQWENSNGHFIDRYGRQVAPANRRKRLVNEWRKRWDVAQEPFKVSQ